MKAYKILWIFTLMIAAGNAWAYGSSSSSKKACEKPKFSEFSPVNNAEVAAKSAFSFLASANTDPGSVMVTVKNQPVDVSIAPEKHGFKVKGLIPADLKGKTARISISADSTKKCKGNDGWLIKVIE
ncbi:MAG: hypothetical protein PHY54_01315 [Methylococcales bacterium]|nr:hypothetical protein [Methylococcales bacterium]